MSMMSAWSPQRTGLTAEIPFLSVIGEVSRPNHSPEPDKVRAIQNIDPPKNVSDVQ